MGGKLANRAQQWWKERFFKDEAEDYFDDYISSLRALVEEHGHLLVRTTAHTHKELWDILVKGPCRKVHRRLNRTIGTWLLGKACATQPWKLSGEKWWCWWHHTRLSSQLHITTVLWIFLLHFSLLSSISLHAWFLTDVNTRPLL